MGRNIKPIHYGTYLQLDKILNAQHPESAKYGEAAHDETLFIITHQAYELWFKQILHDLDWVLKTLAQNPLPEKSIFQIVAKLERLIVIFQLLMDQLAVLETMTPLDFLDFRNYLHPASGFQSIQFRLFEAKLGLKRENRLFPGEGQGLRLTEKEEKELRKVEKEDGLFQLVEAWLERLPFLEMKKFNFWKDYESAVAKMLSEDKKAIESNKLFTKNEREAELKSLKLTQESFQSLLNKQAKKTDPKSLSNKAALATIFISLYRDEPILTGPFRLITALVNIDELLSTWRGRHAMMAHRMLGSKIGTGGSSGHQYLKATVSKNRIFEDFFNISTYLIPRKMLPVLPESIQKQLDLNFRPEIRKS